MRKVSKWILFKGVIAVAALLLTSGVASAQTTSLTNVQTNADYQNGNTEIEIDASIQCETSTDIVSLEAVQNQGRHHAVGVLEVLCSDAALIPGPIPGPFVVPVFDNLKFRSGPFTLLVRVFDVNGAFIAGSGQGFQMKGK